MFEPLCNDVDTDGNDVLMKRIIHRKQCHTKPTKLGYDTPNNDGNTFRMLLAIYYPKTML